MGLGDFVNGGLDKLEDGWDAGKKLVGEGIDKGTNLIGAGLEKVAANGFYDGDLLYAVVTCSPEVWRESPELARALASVVTTLPYVSDYVKSDVERFLSLVPEEM